MGFLSDLFGGSNDDALKAQSAQNRETLAYQKQLNNQARGDLNRLFPQAQETRRSGFADALAMFGQTMPQQFDLMSQGRANVEDTLINGQSQVQRALLGLPTDMSGLRKAPLQVDTSFANRQLPEAVSYQPQQQPFNIAQFLSGYYPGTQRVF